MDSRLLIAALGLVAGAWAFRKWRQAVRMAMILLLIEGALRKWVLPGAQDLIYFAKDGLLLAAYVGYLSRRTRTMGDATRFPLLTGLLALGILFGLLEIFNPNLPNLWVGLFGFKAYFFYVPLLWVLPASFRSREELWRFLYLYILLVIPLGLLALLQFSSPPSSWINAYARGGAGVGVVSTFGSSSFVRVTSTFSYITGFVSYLFATALLLLAVLATIQWRFKGFWLLYGALGLTILGMLVTGSRAPILMFAVTGPLFWWLAAARDRKNFEAISRIALVAGVLGILLASAAGDAVSAFYGRVSSTTDAEQRLLSPFLQPLLIARYSGALGFGIGATHQAATALVDDAPPGSWTQGLVVEDESGRVILELGPIGFLLIYGLRIYLTVLAFGLSLRLRDRFCRSLSIACTLFFLTHLPTGIIFNVTAGLYYWFFGGLLFLALRLDRETTAAQSTGPAVPERPTQEPAFGYHRASG